MKTKSVLSDTASESQLQKELTTVGVASWGDNPLLHASVLVDFFGLTLCAILFTVERHGHLSLAHSAI